MLDTSKYRAEQMCIHIHTLLSHKTSAWFYSCFHDPKFDKSDPANRKNSLVSVCESSVVYEQVNENGGVKPRWSEVVNNDVMHNNDFSFLILTSIIYPDIIKQLHLATEIK